MGGVFFRTKAIDDEGIKIIKMFPAVMADGFHIGEVGEGAEGRVIKAEATGANGSVGDIDGGDLEAI